MELSAIVKTYDLSLTRVERDLVARLPAGVSARSDDQNEQRMKALAAARDVLKQLPDRQTSERQRRTEKIQMLRDRLKILRQTIPFLSPSAAKALKTEMKQIASQVASLDAESGGGNGSAAPASVLPESGNEAGTAQNTAQPGIAEQEGGSIQQKHDGSSGSPLPGLVNSRDSILQERQSKESVEELKMLYRAVLAALKRTQQSGRGNGQFPARTPYLRAYDAIPDSVDSVAVKV